MCSRHCDSAVFCHPDSTSGMKTAGRAVYRQISPVSPHWRWPMAKKIAQGHPSLPFAKTDQCRGIKVWMPWPSVGQHCKATQVPELTMGLTEAFLEMSPESQLFLLPSSTFLRLSTGVDFKHTPYITCCTLSLFSQSASQGNPPEMVSGVA